MIQSVLGRRDLKLLNAHTYRCTPLCESERVCLEKLLVSNLQVSEYILCFCIARTGGKSTYTLTKHIYTHFMTFNPQKDSLC